MNRRSVATLLLAFMMTPASAAHAESVAGPYSAVQLYNQGNALARAGKPGLAVLNYQRARLIAPDDPDIEANLETVSASQHAQAAPRSSLLRLAGRLPPTAAALAGALGVLMLGACILAFRFTRLHRGLCGAGVVLAAAVLAVPAVQGTLLWPTLNAAVVIAPEVPVMATPVPMAEPLFVLPEAQTVTVTAEHDSFALIRTPTGRTGWVAAAKLARVVPK